MIHPVVFFTRLDHGKVAGDLDVFNLAHEYAIKTASTT